LVTLQVLNKTGDALMQTLKKFFPMHTLGAWEFNPLPNSTMGIQCPVGVTMPTVIILLFFSFSMPEI
jgi:hypothetical protein